MKEIQLSNESIAIIDDENYDKVSRYNWRIIKSKIAGIEVLYAIREVHKNGKRNVEKLQHFLFGKPQKGFDMVFKNSNTLDIRKENISYVPHINKYYNTQIKSNEDALIELKELITFNSNKEISELYGVRENYISNYLSKNNIKRDRNNEFSDQRKCTKCNATKNVSEFRKTKNGYRSGCFICEKISDNKYKIDNHDMLLKKANDRYRKENIQALMNGAKRRAKINGLEFDLTLDFLKERWIGRCELSGIPFEKNITRKQQPYRPSIDRIDNNKGYTKDNIRIILWDLNRAINDSGLDTYLNIAISVIKNRTTKKPLNCLANLRI